MSQIALPFLPGVSPSTFVAVGSVSAWQNITRVTLGLRTGIALADPINASGVVQQASLIVDTNKLSFWRRTVPTTGSPIGTILRVRLCYPSAITAATAPLIAPVIRVFGAVGPVINERTFAMRNLEGDASVALPIDANQDSICKQDLTMSTGTSSETNVKVTAPHPTQHAWDCDGYDQFIVAVERAFDSPTIPSGTNQSPWFAWLQAKIV